MRIHELCGECRYFEHECEMEYCEEFCHNPNKKVRDDFRDGCGEIIRCCGFDDSEDSCCDRIMEIPKLS